MRSLFAIEEHSILSDFLDLLRIKYTRTYSNKLYNEHPYKFSLYGLSKMLDVYNIQNIAIKIENKEKGLKELLVPFIAHVGNEFVLVYKKNAKRIYYLWQGKSINVEIEHFNEIWSGIVLVAEANEASVEPDYSKHKTEELGKTIRNLLLIILSVTLFYYCVIKVYAPFKLEIFIIFFFNLIGLYVCTLLLMKQMHIQNNSADKICSLFKKSDCNNILESREAKLGGILSWSELGFGYFVSNLITLLVFPYLINYLAIIGCLPIFFSFWSIWYQKIKVKQWCPLCVCVQIIFWILAVSYWLSDFICFPIWSLKNMFIITCIYILPILITNVICSSLGSRQQSSKIQQQLNYIRMKDEVVTALIKKQVFHKVDHTTSCIKFGNPRAKIEITILTNPHCEPCARMHRRIEKILQKMGDKICVQYIFSSFGKEFDNSSKFLIATYFNHTIDKVLTIYNEWYMEGKYDVKKIFQRYPQDLQDTIVLHEFEKHNQWKDSESITATPTVLINGYTLPREYQIEDVSYFADMEDWIL